MPVAAGLSPLHFPQTGLLHPASRWVAACWEQARQGWDPLSGQRLSRIPFSSVLCPLPEALQSGVSLVRFSEHNPPRSLGRGEGYSLVCRNEEATWGV